jgi:outer membrane translocation and assembly module TamA
LTFNLVHDSRINAINPPGGAYLLLTWRWNAEGLGSTHGNHSLFIDGRKYINMNSRRRHILALRSYYWTVVTGHTPYLDLPATNWAPSTGTSSRGFQSGRYRSNAMLYGEAEQRFQLGTNGLFGMVAFINASSVSEYGTQQFQYWTIGAGAGLRFKFNKYSQTNLSIDFGFSQNYWGVWLNVGEMF